MIAHLNGNGNSFIGSKNSLNSDEKQTKMPKKEFLSAFYDTRVAVFILSFPKNKSI